MKKLTAALLFSAMLLTACGTPASTSPASEATTSVMEESATIAEQALESNVEYSVEWNRYNTQTATTRQYIFAQEQGAIYRLDTSAGEIELLLDTEAAGYPIGIYGLSAFDESLYYIAVKNMQEVLDEVSDTVECGIFRADLNGKNITEVATVRPGIHQLFSFDGFLIAYLDNYGGAPEYKIFSPDSEAEEIVQIPIEELEESWVGELNYYINTHREQQEVFDRMGYGDMGVPGTSAIRANDAYYVLENNILYTLPFSEGEPAAVELAPAVQQAIKDNSSSQAPQLVNYDEDWLYIRAGFGLYGIRKDGSEYRDLVQTEVGSGPLDVSSGFIIYQGTNGQLTVYNISASRTTRTTQELEDDVIEAVRVEHDSRFIINATTEEARHMLGGEAEINPSGIEIVDEVGNEVYFNSIKPGTRLSIAYSGFYYDAEGYTTLYAYKIIVHAD